MNTETTFQEYTMYYTTPQTCEGQVTILGRHYITEDFWLPVLEESEEEVTARLARDEQNRKDGEELRQLAVDLDERCDAVHYANTQYRMYGRV